MACLWRITIVELQLTFVNREIHVPLPVNVLLATCRIVMERVTGNWQKPRLGSWTDPEAEIPCDLRKRKKYSPIERLRRIGLDIVDEQMKCRTRI